MFGNPFFPEGHHGMGPPRPFRTQYRCYSVSMMPGTICLIFMIDCLIFVILLYLTTLSELILIRLLLHKCGNECIDLHKTS